MPARELPHWQFSLCGWHVRGSRVKGAIFLMILLGSTNKRFCIRRRRYTCRSTRRHRPRGIQRRSSDNCRSDGLRRNRWTSSCRATEGALAAPVGKHSPQPSCTMGARLHRRQKLALHQPGSRRRNSWSWPHPAVLASPDPRARPTVAWSLGPDGHLLSPPPPPVRRSPRFASPALRQLLACLLPDRCPG